MYAHTLSEAVTKGKGTERPFLCPVHGDSRPSASLNIIKQKWYCYTCGAHGSLTGEDSLLEPDYLQLQLWFSQKMEENRVYPESWLSRWDAGPIHQYWRDRCGDAAARHFRLGFDAERNAVTYPLRDPAGRVLGVVRRSLEQDAGPRYRYPRGIDVGSLLFNYTPEHRRVVVLVEGALDAIALWNVGIDAFAIYGSRLSRDQVKLIDKIDPDYIFTAFDNDEAGSKAHWAAQQMLKHYQVQKLTWPLSWGKDVDEIGPTRLKKVVHEVLVLTDSVCIESSSCGSSPTGPRPMSRRPSSTISTRSGMRIRRTVA